MRQTMIVRRRPPTDAATTMIIRVLWPRPWLGARREK
jgi:hypothetical protein